MKASYLGSLVFIFGNYYYNMFHSISLLYLTFS